jgi:glucose-6-phosphate isomerase
MRLGEHAAAVSRRLAALGRARFIEGLYRGDPSAWAADAAGRKLIARRLGWVRAPARMLGEAPGLREFGRQVRLSGITHVVLLGMGGSCLGPEVLRRVFGRAPGYPELIVLDTTVPAAVMRVESRVDLAQTLFLVSSKSGTTTETMALLACFWGRMRRLRGRVAGRHFAAITDPGTPLSDLAATRGFRTVFHNPEDIGGRFSVLSNFGMVPAALLGIDVENLLKSAVEAARRCGPGPAPSDNPALALGAALGELGRRGRDKVTLIVGEEIGAYVLWIEQLLAESLGKDSRGLVPVVEAAPAARGGGRSEAALAEAVCGLAGRDRVLVGVSLAGTGAARALEAVVEAPPGSPVGRALGTTPLIALVLRDALDLGASMLQWEIATATAGAVLGVNPFDEPNVHESKENTEAVLRDVAAGRRPLDEPPLCSDGPGRIDLSAAAGRGRTTPPATLAAALQALLAGCRPGDYLALVAYVDHLDEDLRRALEAARARLRDLTGLPATSGYGPRYLHSTGQLHKGGPGSVVVIQVAPDDRGRLPVPGRPYDLETLKQAQALGDFRALDRRGRRVLRLRWAGGAAAALEALVAALRSLGARPATPGRRAAGRPAPRRTGKAAGAPGRSPGMPGGRKRGTSGRRSRGKAGRGASGVRSS